MRRRTRRRATTTSGRARPRGLRTRRRDGGGRASAGFKRARGAGAIAPTALRREGLDGVQPTENAPGPAAKAPMARPLSFRRAPGLASRENEKRLAPGACAFEAVPSPMRCVRSPAPSALMARVQPRSPHDPARTPRRFRHPRDANDPPREFPPTRTVGRLGRARREGLAPPRDQALHPGPDDLLQLRGGLRSRRLSRTAIRAARSRSSRATRSTRDRVGATARRDRRPSTRSTTPIASSIP